MGSGDLSGALWQLVDGVPMAMAPASERHSLLQGAIAGLIRDQLRTNRPTCRTLITPGVVPRAHANGNARVPDIGVTCSPPSDGRVTAAPVLLVEILSPSNEPETRTNVWAHTTIPSVAEILIVRSSRIEAELLRRQPDGHWPAEAMALNAGETLTLDSIGLSVTLDALYATTSLAPR